MTITPVILSGGGGTRLWPMSTPDRPKQFQALTGEHTMFQLTVLRATDRERFDAPIIVANAAHAHLVEEQLNAIGVTDATLILEPCARNTAPAIALAALTVARPEATLLVMPSDHVILNTAAFDAATAALLPLVENGWLATYGISPTGPETGYGYIKMDEAELSPAVHKVNRFVEKPDSERAQQMIASGDHVWNGGIFLFRADVYAQVLADHAPEMLAQSRKAMDGATRFGARITPDPDAFAACPSDSIDYAVMEKADRVAVAPVHMGWSDVGSWDSLHDIGAKDEDGNVLSGAVRVHASTGNLVYSDGVRISVHGIDNLIVVANGTEILIMPRGTSQKVRDFAKD